MIADLFEILHACLEDPHIVVSRYIFIQVPAPALAVSHFSKDTAVGRGDSFDGAGRVVGLEVDVIGRVI